MNARTNTVITIALLTFVASCSQTRSTDPSTEPADHPDALTAAEQLHTDWRVEHIGEADVVANTNVTCLLYTSPSPRDRG